jgi:hypothetical protein
MTREARVYLLLTEQEQAAVLRLRMRAKSHNYSIVTSQALHNIIEGGIKAIFPEEAKK